jgi:Na+/melibiose symporter-like transporter
MPTWQPRARLSRGSSAREDELRSGVRREGAFFGVSALLTRPAESVALAHLPSVLESSGFVAREAHQG